MALYLGAMDIDHVCHLADSSEAAQTHYDAKPTRPEVRDAQSAHKGKNIYCCDEVFQGP